MTATGTGAGKVTTAAWSQPLIRHINLTPASVGDEVAQIENPNRGFSGIRAYGRRHLRLKLLVAIPAVAVALYVGLIESDMYVSQAKFIVRTMSGDSPLQTIGAVTTSPIFSRAPDETYAVAAYLTSRDAVAQLDREGLIRTSLSPQKADFLSRFPNFYRRDTKEAMYRHFKNYLDVSVDGSTGIVALNVTAFTAHDAQLLAMRLLDQSEELVNRLNERARLDSIQYAEDIVSDAEKRLDTISNALATFRNREMVIDPDKEASVLAEQIAKMAGEMARFEIELAEQARMAPNSPAVEPLRAKINSYQMELERLRGRLVGSGGAIANKIEQFTQLALQQSLAAKSLESAILGLDKAKSEAQQKRTYIERVISPNLPDEPALPHRFLYLAGLVGLAFCTYWILSALLENVEEHI